MGGEPQSRLRLQSHRGNRIARPKTRNHRTIPVVDTAYHQGRRYASIVGDQAEVSRNIDDRLAEYNLNQRAHRNAASPRLRSGADDFRSFIGNDRVGAAARAHRHEAFGYSNGLSKS